MIAKHNFSNFLNYFNLKKIEKIIFFNNFKVIFNYYPSSKFFYLYLYILINKVSYLLGYNNRIWALLYICKRKF